MQIIRTSDPQFKTFFKTITGRGAEISGSVEEPVKEILRQVREEGDRALVRLTKQFDGHANITVPAGEMKQAAKKIKKDVAASLSVAHHRITAFHERQRRNSWMQTGADGEILGQLVRPLERVGMYVPGGKAVYPSSVLMNAIPARVAGVEEIIMVTPGSKRGISPLILAAAELCGITRIFQIGGAQAVAALAYGTKTVPRVDKIVGPGNIYVATAKKLVYGQVDIDMIAGPSEVLILSDGTGSPAWVAADMLSQAEHDEMASSILITVHAGFARAVATEITAQLRKLPKSCIAKKSLDDYGAVIVAKDIRQAVALANDVAPEHLELYVKEPWEVLPLVKNAGAVFMGYYSPEPVGDYVAGPNHVLPTGGTARFYSPLSVDDFIKKTSVVCCTSRSLDAVGRDAVRLARAEELEAHARSVSMRLKR